jgi:hypothetical protein
MNRVGERILKHPRDFAASFNAIVIASFTPLPFAVWYTRRKSLLITKAICIEHG